MKAIRGVAERIWESRSPLFARRFGMKRMALFCHSFAALQDGGVPVLRSLHVLGRPDPPNTISDKRLRIILNRVGERVQRGATLGEAFRAERRSFPDLFIELVASGELVGEMGTLLRELATYYDQRVEARRALIRSLVYPAVIVLLAFYLIPFIKGFLRSDLSVEEYLLVYLRQTVRTHAGPAIVFAVLWVTGLWACIWAFVKTYVPPLRGITRRFALGRFFRCWAILLDAGLGVVPAIERAAAATGNPYIRRALVRAVPLVQQGRTLEEAFASMPYLTPLERTMISTGEQAGRIESLLNKVSHELFASAHQRLYTVGVVAEAIATVICGLIVLSAGA